ILQREGKRDLTLSQHNPTAFHPDRHQPSILPSKNLRLRKPQTQDSFIFLEQNASQKAAPSYRPSKIASRLTIKVFYGEFIFQHVRRQDPNIADLKCRRIGRSQMVLCFTVPHEGLPNMG
ncbi:hypothetical protein NPIL_698471, partial [Nephila pilipes]